MRWDRLAELGLELPDVAEATWYGTPALAVRGKGFVRLKEDGEDVVFVLEDTDEQQLLIAAKPAIYHITDHYRGSAAVLARLAKLPVAECRERLEQAWRIKAPATLVRKRDASP